MLTNGLRKEKKKRERKSCGIFNIPLSQAERFAADFCCTRPMHLRVYAEASGDPKIQLDLKYFRISSRETTNRASLLLVRYNKGMPTIFGHSLLSLFRFGDALWIWSTKVHCIKYSIIPNLFSCRILLP